MGSKITLLACGASLCSGLLVSGLYYRESREAAIEREVTRLHDSTRLLEPSLQNLYEEMSKDVRFLSIAPAVMNFSENKENIQWKGLVQSIFMALARSKPYYAQVRIISATDKGHEIIRISRLGGFPAITPDGSMQYIRDLPFYKAALQRKKGEIYFSDITLNREDGKISYPPTPVLRAAIPLYTKHGKLFGILVINATYDLALTQIVSQLENRQILYLTDSSGNYLVHPDKARTFGFEYGIPSKITADIPGLDAFYAGLTTDQTVFFKDNGRDFIFQAHKIFFDGNDKGRFLVIGLKEPKDRLTQHLNTIARISFLLTLFSLAIASLVAISLSRLLTSPLKKTMQEIAAYEGGKKNLNLPVHRRDEIGELASAFESLAENLTLARTAEQQSLARLQAILDNTVDGLITIDEYGIVQTYNKACETIFGHDSQDVIGNNVKILMPSHYADHHDNYLQNYRQGGEAKIIGLGREVEAQHKDGTIFPIELSVAEIRIKGRKIFNGIVRDITQRKKTEEELLRSNMELERFAYIASHDLQEPLRMIANFTALLHDEYGQYLESQGQEYMDFILKASHRMQELVDDLLEYSRIGYEDAGFEDIKAEAHVKVALDNLKEAVEESGAKIRVSPLPIIYVNPVRFRRLIQNLVGNALKYRDRTRIPEICISATDSGSQWTFSIQDNGIGIRREYLQQVFILFKRLHGKNEYSGTGIGLAICKRVAESFGGKIWVESEPGKGSIFHFTIPKREEIRNAA